MFKLMLFLGTHGLSHLDSNYPEVHKYSLFSNLKCKGKAWLYCIAHNYLTCDATVSKYSFILNRSNFKFQLHLPYILI